MRWLEGHGLRWPPAQTLDAHLLLPPSLPLSPPTRGQLSETVCTRPHEMASPSRKTEAVAVPKCSSFGAADVDASRMAAVPFQWCCLHRCMNIYCKQQRGRNFEILSISAVEQTGKHPFSAVAATDNSRFHKANLQTKFMTLPL